MAIALDAVSKSTDDLYDSELGSSGWTHTPVGTPKGVLVMIVSLDEATTNTGNIASVTYGGSSLTQVALSPLIGSAGLEDAVVYGFFLGSSVPTGAQTVLATPTNNWGCRYICTCYTLTGATNLEVADTSTISQNTGENPSGTLSLGGTSSWCVLAGLSGVSATSGVTQLGNWTSRNEYDYASNVGVQYSYDTVGTADVTFGWTALTDDAHILAVAIREVPILRRIIYIL